MVYLHSPRVFQSLMVLSREPDTICLLSAEKATDKTSLACPTNRRVVRPDWISHSRRVPSHDPDLIHGCCRVVRFVSVQFTGRRARRRAVGGRHGEDRKRGATFFETANTTCLWGCLCECCKTMRSSVPRVRVLPGLQHSRFVYGCGKIRYRVYINGILCLVHRYSIRC